MWTNYLIIRFWVLRLCSHLKPGHDARTNTWWSRPCIRALKWAPSISTRFWVITRQSVMLHTHNNLPQNAIKGANTFTYRVPRKLWTQHHFSSAGTQPNSCVRVQSVKISQSLISTVSVCLGFNSAEKISECHGLLLGQLKTGKWLATKFENVARKITRTEFGNTNGQRTCTKRSVGHSSWSSYCFS